MKFHRVELELKTVTPAFIGGSDPATEAEWAVKSVRGHLRWWFRAVMGGERQGDADAVRELEDELFGSTSHKSPLKILAPPVRESTVGDLAEGHPLDETQLANAWGATDPAVRARLRLSRGATNPIAYLGYGPIAWNRDQRKVIYERARIRSGRSMRLLLQWRDRLPSEDALQKALWCWLHLGGIGGRSRRGFGSLECVAIRTGNSESTFLNPVQTIAQFEEYAKSLLATACGASAVAQWSHFTKDTRIYVSTAPYQTWDAALSAAGAWLIAFRRRYGLTSDERTSVRNRDYVWLKGSPPPAGVPDRAGFGLPLPFGQGEDLVAAWRSGDRRSGEHEESGRRGSPLLIHVARFEGKHHLVFTHMPALLVPKGKEIHFRGQHSPPTVEQKRIVSDFLDDLDKVRKKIRRTL